MSPSPHQQINTCLTAYCRGVDRLDPEALSSAFHPDAVLRGYGRRDRGAIEFVPFAIEGLRKAYSATQHRLSNVSIHISGSTARVESYVTADHLLVADGVRRLHVFAGRYIDDFDERGGEWRITSRTLRHDWTHDTELSGFMPGDWTDGSRDRSDAVYDGVE